MPDSSCTIAICDANILIDYLSVDADILREMSAYWKAVFVPDCIIHEVPHLSEERAAALNIVIMPTPYTDLHRVSGLSFADLACLYYVEKLDAVCLTNDVRLRKACSAINKDVVWGLEIMLRLVSTGQITKARAKNNAIAIHENNSEISSDILEEFFKKLEIL